MCPLDLGRKIPKTLSGIETKEVFSKFGNIRAAKYLKPYQGLKRILPEERAAIERKAAKYLKPYQGLKRHFPPGGIISSEPPQNT